MSNFLKALRIWWSRDPLQEETEKFCARLRAMGIDAQMLQGGLQFVSLIGITGGPIQRIRIRKEVQGGGDYDMYYADYVVSDFRLFQRAYRFTISTVRVRIFPVFGRVVDLRWKGSDCGTGIIDQLQGDMLIRQAIMKSGDITIHVHSGDGEWKITPTRDCDFLSSEEQWNCYQAIARHLLAMKL